MVTFTETTQRNTRAIYIKDDLSGYKGIVNANYNLQNKLTDANRDIRYKEDKDIANFNVYGEGEYARVNLTDCIAGRMSEAVEVAEAALADLAATYPQE